MPLDITATMDEIRNNYKTDPNVNKVNILEMGDFGTGKSTALTTAPKPILVHSFDPGGMSGRLIQPLIESGAVLVERFEDENPSKPTQWARFDKRMSQLDDGGFFRSGAIKTFAIDSLTSLADAVMNFIAGKAGRAGQQPQLQDYQTQQIMLRNLLMKCCSLPVNFICTGHMKIEKDETLGKILSSLMVSGKLDIKIPILFDEVYVCQAKETSKGSEYKFLTCNDGFYRARTRMGAGIFEKLEEQNIEAMMKKAGKIK